MSDNVSTSKIHQIINLANATNTRLTNNPKRKKQEFSPNTVIKRKEEERERSKKRRIEAKNALNNTPEIKIPEILIIIDDILTNIYTLSVIQLKRFLKCNNIKNDGNKEELINKIKLVSKFINIFVK